MLRYFMEDDDFELFCSTMYQHYPECEADKIPTHVIMAVAEAGA